MSHILLVMCACVIFGTLASSRLAMQTGTRMENDVHAQLCMHAVLISAWLIPSAMIHEPACRQPGFDGYFE
jgi:hypothetical protein